MPTEPRVAFVYPNPRRALAEAVLAGTAPDTGLLGQNHLAEQNIDAVIVDSRLRRATRLPGLAHRVTWLGRELTIPWETGDADIIVTSLATLLPVAARIRRRARVVVLNINLCTTLARLDGPRRRVLERSLRTAETIVCFAEAQRAKLLDQTSVDPARVSVVALGVDERFHQPVAAPVDTRVLAVGRDNGRDYATFAEAMRRIGAPGTIVASSRNLQDVAVPPNVEVVLDVDPIALRTLYASATCVVVPTRSREFALGADCSGQTVLLDAMAMGRPAVVTHRATLDEYVDDGATALFAEPEDPRGLASAITTILDDPALAARLGTGGRAAVEGRFTTTQLAAGLAPVIRRAHEHFAHT